MAKYQIRHSCGCGEEVNISGKINLRAAQAERLSNKKCSACYRKDLAADAAVAAAAAALPALRGTDKQKTWALTIRQKSLTDLNALVALVKPDPENLKLADAAVKIVSSKDEASWWIDRRHDSAMQLFEIGMKTNAKAA